MGEWRGYRIRRGQGGYRMSRGCKGRGDLGKCLLEVLLYWVAGVKGNKEVLVGMV